MARSMFKLKSGNNTPFKMIGSSPAKQDTNGDGKNIISLDDYRASNDTTQAYMHQVSIDPEKHEPIHSGLDLAVYNFLEDKHGKEGANKKYKTGQKNRVKPSKASSDKLKGHEVTSEEYYRSHERANNSIIE